MVPGQRDMVALLISMDALDLQRSDLTSLLNSVDLPTFAVPAELKCNKA